MIYKSLVRVNPIPLLLAGVIKHRWKDKDPETVSEIKKRLYVDDLIEGGITTAKAKERKMATQRLNCTSGIPIYLSWSLMKPNRVPKIKRTLSNSLGFLKEEAERYLACSGTSKETPQVSLYKLRKPTTLKGGY